MWSPCRPHEPCYQGSVQQLNATKSGPATTMQALYSMLKFYITTLRHYSLAPSNAIWCHKTLWLLVISLLFGSTKVLLLSALFCCGYSITCGTVWSFVHIMKSCFDSTEEILYLPQCEIINPEGYGQMRSLPNPIKAQWRMIPEIILCMRPANERWRYNVTLCLIGRAHS